MSFELDRAQCARAARAIDELAASLATSRDLPLADDRLARALGDVPSRSDELARELHRAALDELRALAAQIRSYSRDTAAADDASAAAIEALL